MVVTELGLDVLLVFHGRMRIVARKFCKCAFHSSVDVARLPGSQSLNQRRRSYCQIVKICFEFPANCVYSGLFRV